MDTAMPDAQAGAMNGPRALAAAASAAVLVFVLVPESAIASITAWALAVVAAFVAVLLHATRRRGEADPG
jgi:hypothetical protein